MGLTTLVFGLLLLWTPLPVGWILVPLGMIILAGEFACFRRWLDAIENHTGGFGRKLRDAETAARAKAPRWMSPPGEGPPNVSPLDPPPVETPAMDAAIDTAATDDRTSSR